MSAGTLPTPDLDLFGDGPERDTVVRVLNGWHCTAQCAFMARCARRVFPLFLPPTSLPDILRLTMLGGYTSILTMVEAQAMRFEQPVALRIGQFARAQETATSAFVPVHRLESRDLTLLNDFVAWHFLESRLMPSERAARTVLAAGAATGLIADVSFLPAAALINRLAFEAALAGYQAGLPDPTDLPRPHPSGPDELESAVRSACRELRDAVAADLCALAIRSDWERINGLMAGATDGVLPALDPSETGPLGPLWPKVEPDWYRAGLFRHRELYASVGFGPVPAIPPTPDVAVVAMDDHRWSLEQIGSGAWSEYQGQFVAVLDQKVVGHAKNSLQLQRRLVKKLGVEPLRFTIVYVEPDDDPLRL